MLNFRINNKIFAITRKKNLALYFWIIFFNDRVVRIIMYIDIKQELAKLGIDYTDEGKDILIKEFSILLKCSVDWISNSFGPASL